MYLTFLIYFNLCLEFTSWKYCVRVDCFIISSTMKGTLSSPPDRTMNG